VSNHLELDDDAKTLVGHLYIDWRRSIDLYKEDRLDQFARRTLIKSITTYFEGFSRSLRTSLLNLESANRLSFDKICVLNDKKLDVSDNGVIEKKAAKYSSVGLLAVAFRCWCELSEISEHEIRQIFGHNDWRKYKETISVRNRLTHPKPGDSFEVSDVEVETALDAMQYMLDLTVRLANIHFSETSGTDAKQ